MTRPFGKAFDQRNNALNKTPRELAKVRPLPEVQRGLAKAQDTIVKRFRQVPDRLRRL